MTRSRGAAAAARFTLGLAVALLAAFIDGAMPAADAQAPAGITGEVPAPGGIALVVWGGGSVEALTDIAAAGGCPALRSIWSAPPGLGRLVGLLPGAPEAVNRPFLDAYPDSQLPPATPLVLVCAATTPPPPTVHLERALGGQGFDEPIELGAYPGGRVFVAQRPGLVTITGRDGGPAATILDVRHRVTTEGGEEGLLSFALDPGFEINGYAYAYYSATSPRRTVLSRFRVADDRIDASTELVLLEVIQPFSNHNGGAIRFGPDGLLYLGVGDGGSAGDPRGNGQDPGTLLGTVVRLDVRAASFERPYEVPAGNAGRLLPGARDEVWAYGFRNPWRMAFDPATDALWLADVGQSRFEEIDLVRLAGNYGWNRVEGNECYQPGCSTSGTVLPVATYPHDQGCSVSGGVVYRGSVVPSLAGHYVYGDFCSGRIWALPVTATGAAGPPIEIADTDLAISTFGEDGAGNVYVVDFNGGVYRLVEDR